MATAHLLASSAFLALGGILTVLAMASVSFLSLSGPLSYGRLRPMAMLVVMLGWLVPAFAGTAYYLLPRLTGAPLFQPRLAALGLLGTSGLTILGVLWLALGLGDGTEPFGLPWYLDVLILGVVSIPAIVTFGTIRNRNEEGVFASLWFVMAAVIWLPGLALVSALPNLAAIGRQLQEVVFSSGFQTLWVTAMGFGVAYYVAVKQTDNPLANRQIAKAGFWSLAFAGAFLGPVQVAFGPTPDWLDSISAVLSLALPVSAVATAAAVATTIDDDWSDASDRPALLAVGHGLALAIVASVLSVFGAFSSAAALVGFTAFWDGIQFLVLFGVGGTFLSAFAYQAIPPMTGRQIDDIANAGRQIRLVTWGSLTTGLLLVIAGMLTGFAWTGGSYTASYTDAGEGWAQAMALPNVFIGVAVLGALVTFVGQLMFVRNVASSITSGTATAQEVLVYTRADRAVEGGES
ncbi:MAG: cbb3-type cytochrome c oxidase subunit I [Acidimicrobiia bacterium]|nr:cbb3-type cytochrome c oxidase subunit I [Acidimicrobiia bacterium]